MFIIITSHTTPLRYQKSINRLQEISAHLGAQVPLVRDTAKPITCSSLQPSAQFSISKQDEELAGKSEGKDPVCPPRHQVSDLTPESEQQ